MGQGQKDGNKVVIGVDMDCEACKKRVRRIVRSFPGVENIDLDMDGQKVTVTGNVDTWKMYETLRKKCGKRTTLIYPQLSKEEQKKAKEDSIINSVNKIVESITDLLAPKPPNTTVELRIPMHCGACARKVKHILLRLNGVTDVEADMVIDRVVVKGRDLDVEVLCERVKQSGKQCELISFKKEEKPAEKKTEQKGKKAESKEEKKEKEDSPGKVKKENGQKNLGNQATKSEGKEKEEKEDTVQGKEKQGKKKEDKKEESKEEKIIESKETGADEKKTEDVEAGSSKKDKKQQKKEREKNPDDKPGKDAEAVKEGNKSETKEGKSVDAKEKETMVYADEGEQDEMELRKFVYMPYQSYHDYAYAPQLFNDENPNACTVM